MIAFQAAHRSQPRLQSGAVGLDPIVRVHGCVVLDTAQLVLDGSINALALSVVTCSGRACSARTRWKKRRVACPSRRGATRCRSPDRAGQRLGTRSATRRRHGRRSRRRTSSHPTRGGRAGGFDQLRRESLDPPVDRHVIDGDAALSEEFVNVAVGEPEAQVPAHREQDHVGREPIVGERRARHHDATTTTSTRSHPASLTRDHPGPPTQQTRPGSRAKELAGSLDERRRTDVSRHPLPWTRTLCRNRTDHAKSRPGDDARNGSEKAASC